MKVVQVFHRFVYGKLNVYPANDQAIHFAKLLGVKTFNQEQLNQIREIGFEIENTIDPAAHQSFGDFKAESA